MKLITEPKGSGKTYQLIMESATNGDYIVCHSSKEAERIFSIANEHKLNIPFPLTYDEFINKRYYSKGIKGILIDNVDILLDYMSDGLVKTITIRN